VGCEYETSYLESGFLVLSCFNQGEFLASEKKKQDQTIIINVKKHRKLKINNTSPLGYPTFKGVKKINLKCQYLFVIYAAINLVSSNWNKFRTDPSWWT
jgi:hypothetical protein